jgi:glycosidase
MDTQLEPVRSIESIGVLDAFEQAQNNAKNESTKTVMVDGSNVEIPQPFPSPEDWRDTWIYFLMVDRFNNPDDSPNHPPFDEAIGTFQGGKIKGIKAQLPYLQELGAKAIWLSPILKNRQSNDFNYHGYGIQDFLNIDPRFGSEQDFHELVCEAHARGMYVIMDIVLNHAGDVFGYRDFGNTAPPSPNELDILWRDESGNPIWPTPPPNPHQNATVFPDEIRKNMLFRRKGVGGEAGGDFLSLKEMVTEFEEFSPPPIPHFPVRDILIQAYQYWIAKADIDGYRIDTLKFIKPEFARIFGNAMREYALSIGKRNFFTFGEIFDSSEEKIKSFIGKDTSQPGQPVGVDSALDFPLFFQLPSMIKGFIPPSDIVGVFQNRREAQKGLLSSNGEAGQFFVTFLDNHDMHSRFYFQQENGNKHQFDAQVSMGVACMFGLLGIPALYYGTEQGLHGSGNSDQNVREALWGNMENPPFDTNHPFYKTIKEISELRECQPALRYGRQYFRPISGNGTDFGVSNFQQGVLAFSRILNDTEILMVLNTNTSDPQEVDVIVDYSLNPEGIDYGILFSNMDTDMPVTVSEKPRGNVSIHETNGSISNGPLKTLRVSLKPMEVQVLGRI